MLRGVWLTILLRCVDLFVYGVCVYVCAGQHFNRLLQRHGSPILILDLTKRRESRMHESTLGPRFKRAVDQLNMTMLPCFRLDYRRLDMAYLNKL